MRQGIVAILLFALCGLLIVRLDKIGLREIAAGARIVDGDTLDVGGERVRLWGLDAFEAGQQCSRPTGRYDCGAAARAHLASLAGGEITCTGRTLDRYGRLLAVCESGGRDLNAQIVSAGWAVTHGGYAAEESAARNARRGAWVGDFALPADWRAGRGGTIEPRHDGLAEWLQGLVRRFWPGANLPWKAKEEQ